MLSVRVMYDARREDSLESAEKRGSVWQRDELDAIVADYFAMLRMELEGTQFTKSHHSADLMTRIGRSHRSVEFKHQNISAVLDELGMPWIRGYRPKTNYQNAIIEAVERYLSDHHEAVQLVSLARMAPQPSEPTPMFVDPPQISKPDDVSPRMRRTIQKFDPVERDQRNRRLGKAGEEFVFHLERNRLVGDSRPDLARKVRWVAAEDGDGAGFDILSFETSGCERLIEVKTTNGTARTPFFLTRNECELAEERPRDWQIYRVYSFVQTPHIFTLRPPLTMCVHLRPESWRATF